MEIKTQKDRHKEKEEITYGDPSNTLFFKDIEADCKKIIEKEVTGFILNKVFDAHLCGFFITTITNNISEKLTKLSPFFKYIIGVVFLQNHEKGYTQNIMSTFDRDTDGTLTLEFPFEEIVCIVNLICTSI